MTETQAAPMNGNFPAQHAYHDSYNPAHAAMTNAATFQPTQSSTPSNVPQAGDMKSGLSKDEVGWYFVEQYYTNMSRCPEKLHHFYSRRSQFVFGNEAETVPVVVGQKDINEKIKQLDFQECKVRVLNVDSQASFDNILVSVIGEISNKSEPSRKFVQTFVLAEQPNGYYVLNDIFRYLTEDEEISNEEPTPAANQQAAAAQAPAELAAPAEAAPAPTDAKVDNESAAHKVDEKLEEQAQPNGEAAHPAAAQQTNGEASAEKTAETPAPAAAAAVESESTQNEYPPSPEPTPVPAEPKEPAAPKEEAPAAAPARAVPKTWANIASKPGSTAPVVPAAPTAAAAAAAAPSKAASTTPSSTQQAAPATAPSQPAAAAAATTPTESKPASTDNSGWQTAGTDHKKTQSRAGDEPNTLAYIKNVNDKVDASLLRDTLTSFGKLKYFDVSRAKNCAFVEFAEPAGYAAAVAANPHQIGSEQITVEERRPRGNAYGGNAGFGHGRGGAGRGRGDRAGSQGRGGFQRDGRGGFAPRGRGGNVGAKGRNQAQAA